LDSKRLCRGTSAAILATGVNQDNVVGLDVRGSMVQAILRDGNRWRDGGPVAC
jgi:hypothetical protein